METRQIINMKTKAISIMVNGNTYIIIDNKNKFFLPPIRKKNKKALPRTDFNFLGKAIVGNLSFSELGTEISQLSKAKSD